MMKTLRTLSFATCLLIFSALSLFAQCDKDFPFRKGTTYEHTEYNSQNIETGKGRYEVKKVVKTPLGLDAELHFIRYDSTNKEFAQGSFSLNCEGDVIKFDASSPQWKVPENVEMQTSKFFLESPLNLEVGQTLKDAETEIRLVDKETKAVIMYTKLSVVNRKVESKQKITTPAGTYDAYKITAAIITETEAGGKKKQSKITQVEYRAKEVGMVKREDYDSEGKLLKYSLLTKFKK